MKQLQRVVWSEGMFLMPEHFQAADRAAEENLHFRFTASNFANWGFTKLEINLDKLANGTFEIVAAEGILPDGMAFSMPGCDSLPLGCSVDSVFPATQKFLDAWLALPALQPNGSNVLLSEEEQPDTNYRYRSQTQHMSGENLDPDLAGPEPKALQLGMRNFKILFSPPAESLNGFTTIRMGQIKRNAAGKYELDDVAVPPCLDFASNPYLRRLLDRRIEKLTARSRNLVARRQPALGGTGLANVQDQLLLLTINSFLPGLKHLKDVRKGHPELPYFQLLNLVGALSSFSAADPGELPVYDHNNIGLRYTELDRAIDNLLEPPTKERCIEIPLVHEGLFWFASLHEGRYFGGGKFFLGIKAHASVPDLIRAALRTKIGSREGIDRLYRSAVNGVELHHETLLPPNCATKLDFQYFQLSQTGPFWDEIRTSGEMGIYMQSVITDAEVDLLIALT